MSNVVINTKKEQQLPRARWDIRDTMFVMVSTYQNLQELERKAKLGSISFLWEGIDVLLTEDYMRRKDKRVKFLSFI